jgi:hypothetical protein
MDERRRAGEPGWALPRLSVLATQRQADCHREL